MSANPARKRKPVPPRIRQTPAAAVHTAVRVEAAANDDKPKTEFSVFGDPLFGMAIASVILLAVLAALIAAS